MYGQTVTHDHRHDDEHDTTAGVTGRGRDRPADQRPAGAGTAAAVRHDAAEGDTSAYIAGTVHGERGQVPRTSPRRDQPPVQRCQQEYGSRAASPACHPGVCLTGGW